MVCRQIQLSIFFNIYRFRLCPKACELIEDLERSLQRLLLVFYIQTEKDGMVEEYMSTIGSGNLVFVGYCVIRAAVNGRRVVFADNNFFFLRYAAGGNNERKAITLNPVVLRRRQRHACKHGFFMFHKLCSDAFFDKCGWI